MPASSFEARCGDPTGLSVLLHNTGVIARVVPNLINFQECFTVNCTGGIFIRYSYPYFTSEEIDAVRLPTPDHPASKRWELGLRPPPPALVFLITPCYPASLNCQALPVAAFNP